jgi:hypothetical protein
MVSAYVCDKGHIFLHSAKLTTTTLLTNTEKSESVEIQICPYCHSLDISEAPEDTPQNTLVIELTVGPQIAIDKAVAEGYKIVNRYAGKYVLEKPKFIETKTLILGDPNSEPKVDI